MREPRDSKKHTERRSSIQEIRAHATLDCTLEFTAVIFPTAEKQNGKKNALGVFLFSEKSEFFLSRQKSSDRTSAQGPGGEEGATRDPRTDREHAPRPGLANLPTCAILPEGFPANLGGSLAETPRRDWLE